MIVRMIAVAIKVALSRNPISFCFLSFDAFNKRRAC